MLLLLLLYVLGLLLQSDAQDRASLWRGNDRGGRCHYSFTVPSPVESSCPQTGGPELEGLKARLGLLEALVSRLTGADAGATQAQSEVQEALDRALGERNLLRGEKEKLERELMELQRRMEDMRR